MLDGDLNTVSVIILFITRCDVSKGEHATALLLHSKPLFPSLSSEEGCRNDFKLLSDTVTHVGTLQLAVSQLGRTAFAKQANA